jgi:hypothetical protein
MAEEQSAWLESRDSNTIPIQGNLSIGRSPKNGLVLDSLKISRRHALVNVQNVGEFWLIDLGSSNGTFLNKRRVHQPVQLCDQAKSPSVTPFHVSPADGNFRRVPIPFGRTDHSRDRKRAVLAARRRYREFHTAKPQFNER